ncbi:hypothetical protein GJAV_G00161240 [Gymnothorax javanicus]|nr:hypothetical protein GJAV_G00161240 [Gymnothorax javanicus]
MFGVMHPGRKYSPTQYLTGSWPVTVSTESKESKSLVDKELGESLDSIWLPQYGRLRNSKVKGIKAIKRRSSPNRSLEVAEVMVNELPQEKGLNPPERGGAAHRGRKKSYRPPDVRTIFESPEKDPRVPVEKGEGHVFCPDVSGAWCDLCCEYIFQYRLTCTGCKYTCHTQCRGRVSLDCHPSGPATQSQDHLNNNRNSVVSVTSHVFYQRLKIF